MKLKILFQVVKFRNIDHTADTVNFIKNTSGMKRNFGNVKRAPFSVFYQMDILFLSLTECWAFRPDSWKCFRYWCR